MAHVLYRFYSDTGHLLYVGITMNPSQRFHKHKHTKDWWDEVVGITLQHYLDRESLAAAERRAIEVERPLYNIARPKMKQVAPTQQPIPEPEPMPEPPSAGPYTGEVPPGLFDNLFKPKPDPDPYWENLIGYKSYRDTRYGVVDDETYAKRDAAELAKWDAIRACTLCDRTGYRGRSLCRHTKIGSSKAREAMRRVQRERLQVVDGGDF